MKRKEKVKKKSLKLKVVNYLRPLIEDSNRKISLGRVAFWIVFGIAMRSLYITGDLSANVIGLVSCLLAYSVGKLFVRNKYHNGLEYNGTEHDDY